MNGQIRQRSPVGRVAVPIEEAPARPSLVPSDVWESWQRELAVAEAEAEASVEEVHEVEEVISSSEITTGLGATTGADFEVALLALGRVGLFARLERSGLEALAKEARQGELQSGDDLFREGEPARSFFVVLDGAVEVLRRIDGREVALRHVDRSEPMGLFGLLSGQRRAATARAIGDAILLEVPGAALNDAIAHHADLRERVIRFYEERLLEGFVGSSRLFADVDSIARARIIGRFQERRLRAQETLVQMGEVSNLVAIVISGTLRLERRPAPGEQPQLFELYPGEFLMLTAAFSGAPCRMRVFSPEGATVVMLGHRELTELLRDHPALRGLNLRLPQHGQPLDRDVWCGHTAVPGL